MFVDMYILYMSVGSSVSERLPTTHPPTHGIPNTDTDVSEKKLTEPHIIICNMGGKCTAGTIVYCTTIVYVRFPSQRISKPPTCM